MELNNFEVKKASTEFFCSCYDKLKQKNKNIYTNSYRSTNYYSEKFDKKDCKLYIYENSFFIVIPVYDFKDVVFFSASKEQFKKDFSVLCEGPLKHEKIKIELVCRNNSSVIELEEALAPLNMVLRSQNIRFTSAKNIEAAKRYYEVLKEMIKIVPEHLNNPGLAREDEAERIHELLLSEFDAVDDNVPEIEDIREKANNGQIIVVRNESGKIVSLRYFTIENNIISNWFDVTDVDYRGKSLINLISYYQINLFIQQGRKFTRCYSWRNAKKTRLIKVSNNTKDAHDGTIITSFFRNSL